MSRWSGWPAPTRRPPAWEAGALPTELQPHGVDDGLRPRDLRLGKAVLYQLSYVHIDARTGIEPAYICFAGSDLAFRSHRAVKMKIEPRKKVLQKSGRGGSNSRNQLGGLGPWPLDDDREDRYGRQQLSRTALSLRLRRYPGRNGERPSW